MKENPKANLLAELPAGEWTDIQVLNQSPGMMSAKDWAIFAKAKWLRGGGKSAFIKLIIPAGSKAGRETQLVTGSSRLKALHERLQFIRSLGDKVPLVPLLDVRLSSQGLLIAMEEVTTLQTLIEKGQSYNLSLNILRDLEPGIEGRPSWFHFDICPQNIGFLANGRCVLIDVESFYLEENKAFNVTIPAWKPFRAPLFLQQEVEEKLATMATDQSLALKKTGFEITLAAAECMLGQLQLAQEQLDEGAVEDWLRTADISKPIVAFWQQTLLAMIRTKNIPPLRKIAQQLDGLLNTTRQEKPLPPGKAGMLPPVKAAKAAIEHHKAPELPQNVSKWDADWLPMKEAARALRIGQLDQAQLADYQLALERLARQHPTRREVWDELLLVSISYLKDPLLALDIAEKALANIPGDTGLVRQRSIVQMWATGKKNDNDTD